MPHGITIFGRVRPTKKAYKGLTVDFDDEEKDAILSVNIPKHLEVGEINNRKEDYKFRFSHVFEANAKQDDVFQRVAKPVADSVLQGYNGTIFAYGQTGTGKTFTITGGPDSYADRGIIPRTLSYLFNHYTENPASLFTTQVSYLEIYNQAGYDLLDPRNDIKAMEDLPKVTLLEDGAGGVHLKNLSMVPVNSEEEALNALFLGDTNRMIAETPMNMASTRSHCIFTIHVTAREAGSATLRKAKLHLVDLAGSERVKKSQVEGMLLTEAKYINLSLHFLEQVIVALAEKRRTHVPYRNSMMTSVLRDSLGGNCMTTMIATMSAEAKNLDETISTCRFSQRVALVKNDARLNEETDPKLVIAKLKREVARLKEELLLANGQTEEQGPLTDDEIEECRGLVQQYLHSNDPEHELSLADPRKIRACFDIMKEQINTLAATAGESTDTVAPAEVEHLQSLLAKRDHEIAILVAKLKRERAMHTSAPPTRPTSSRPSAGSTLPLKTSSTGSQGTPPSTARKPEAVPAKARELTEEERQQAYDDFKAQYPPMSTINQQKDHLKTLVAEAKATGNEAAGLKQSMEQVKAQLEQHRLSLVPDMLEQGQQILEDDPTEQRLRQQLDGMRARYRSHLDRLKELKREVDHLKHLLQTAKVKLHQEFETWLQQA
eukprot:TRINITY_DN12646_c4_g1_i11.p2 TRINITY_DN12646_c4_g1~~TRINITY_DN12646_c4_g1_i11.p2  ORF type:complete len:662 (+),score=176.32 TRINITY_DN12646_c4_g1_i11:95-2080(+)